MDLLQRLQLEGPASRSATDRIGRRVKLGNGFPHDLVMAPVVKVNGVSTNHRLVVLPCGLPGTTPNLENVNEISVEVQLQDKIDSREIEILEAQTVIKSLRREQL